VAFRRDGRQRALTPLAVRTCEFGDQAPARGFLQLVEPISRAERLGEVVVDGVSPGASSRRGGFKLGRLAGKLFAGVFFGMTPSRLRVSPAPMPIQLQSTGIELPRAGS